MSNRILRRPMFRMGGSANEGITSGLDKPKDNRIGFADGTTKERLLEAMGQAPQGQSFNNFLI